MKKLFIIILDYKNKPVFGNCFKSVHLAKVPKSWQKEILVVDNNKINLGFAKGMNKGIKEAMKKGAEAVLLLNQDTVVEKNFLIPLLTNKADIVSPVIKFRREGKRVYDFGGRINWWIGRSKHLESLRDSWFKSLKIDYVSGCAMLIKKSVLEKIGFFNEKYFFYFEDVDFCLRAKKAGFTVACEPKSIVLHQLVEGENKPFFQRWHLIKSNFIFINSWIDWWRRPIAWLYWLLLCLKNFL